MYQCRTSIQANLSKCSVTLATPACRLAPGETWESEFAVRWTNDYWPRPAFEHDMLPMPALERQVTASLACISIIASIRKKLFFSPRRIHSCLCSLFRLQEFSVDAPDNTLSSIQDDTGMEKEVEP